MRLNVNTSFASIFDITVLGFQMLMICFLYPFWFLKKNCKFVLQRTMQSNFTLSNTSQGRITLKCKAINCVGDYFMILIENPLQWMEMYCTWVCMVSRYPVLHSFILTSRAAIHKTSRWSSQSFCKTSSWFSHLWTKVTTLEIGKCR